MVTIDKYGMFRGLKVGTTEIDVYQKVKNKNQQIGTLKVKVVKASLDKKQKNIELINSEHDYFWGDILISNKNLDAKYKFKTSNKKIVKIGEYNSFVAVGEGKAKITITETYKKKTRTIGTVNVHVKEVPINNMIINRENVEEIDGVNTVIINKDEYDYTYDDLSKYITIEPRESYRYAISKVDKEGIIEIYGDYIYYNETGEVELTVVCDRAYFMPYYCRRKYEKENEKGI